MYNYRTYYVLIITSVAETLRTQSTHKATTMTLTHSFAECQCGVYQRTQSGSLCLARVNTRQANAGHVCQDIVK